MKEFKRICQKEFGMGLSDKETPTIMEASIKYKANQKIIKPSLGSQIDFHLKNLDRLIDQDTYWFCKRIEAIQAKDHHRVNFIEKTYLIPLQRKIKELAERMARL